MMGKYKICVYAISKNEEKFVHRWMDAVSEAEAVIVLDTGSGDRTVERLRKRGALVYEKRISPWRFDEARNYALSCVPEDTDICVSNDLDEVFEPGWRRKLESAWCPGHTRARYLFVWDHKPDGSPRKCYFMEKIHRRHGFKWVHPVHEILEYDGVKGEERILLLEGIVLHHYPDLTKSRENYLPLLELSVSENPGNDRAMFWLGREYVYRGEYDLGIEILTRHLALPSARWEEERSASMRLIAQCYEAKGNKNKARAWLFRALGECPDVREPYLGLVRFGYREGNWPLVYAMADKGLSIVHRTDSYLVEPESWGFALYDYAALAAYRLGLYEKAGHYALKAFQLNPADKRLKLNLELISQRCIEHFNKGW